LQAGYREGIIAGKEASLQEGFDSGFANVGVPIGRELGNLQGIASALIAFLSEDGHDLTLPELEEARAIATALSQIRFSDIAPGDLEAEQHAREHLEDINDDPAISQMEELSQKRDMESLEDMLSHLAAGSGEGTPRRTRPTREDVAKLKERLALLSTRLTLGRVSACTSCSLSFTCGVAYALDSYRALATGTCQGMERFVSIASYIRPRNRRALYPLYLCKYAVHRGRRHKATASGSWVSGT